LIALVLVASFVAILPLANHADAESVSSWGSGTNFYPLKIDPQSCEIYSGYIYCVGGDWMNGGDYTSAVYYAPVSNSGVGVWTNTTSYPTNIYDQSCAIYSGYIYCVGGYATYPSAIPGNPPVGGVTVTDATYYARVSSSGVGSWNRTTSYPTGVAMQSCAIYSGYIYCVGGANPGGDNVGDYYAQISSSGVGVWIGTASYPAGLNALIEQSCAIYSGYIYCVGEGPASAANPLTNATYYAPVSSSGLGAWNRTTSYPTGISYPSCTTYSGYIYCVGGLASSAHGVVANNATYYAPLSSSGVGNWTSTSSYPFKSIYGQSCAIYSGYIYCVGGIINSVNTISDSSWTSAVYYAEISPQTIMTMTSTSTVTTVVTQLQTTTVVTSSSATTELLAVAVVAAILVLAGSVLVTRRRPSTTA
jgi:N-acetylneuraminic acid mutarotase